MIGPDLWFDCAVAAPRQVEMVLAGSLINLVLQKSHNLEYP